jgi:ankyrin repeat protein
MQCREDAGAVRALLAADPESIHEKDCDGKTPLHHAASGHNVQLVLFLIERGPRTLLLERDNAGRVPLHCAADFAREGGGEAAVRVAQVLVDACPESARVRANDGCLPLHLAAGEGSIDLARLLVGSWSASVREADRDGLLPLHHAATSEQDIPSEDILDMARLLIEQWPESVHERDGMGRTLLHMVVIVYWAAERCEQLVAFVMARIPECVQAQDDHGQLPLHVAEVPSVARRLLEAWEPAIRAKDRLGRLPVHSMLGRLSHSFPMVYRPEDNSEDREESRLKTARYLAERWPEYSAGWVPLHFLLECAGSALDVVTFFVETRPQALQARDLQGRVPLHVWAARPKSSPDAGRILVKVWPESLLVADHMGQLPLHVLLERENASLDKARLLVETRPESLHVQDHQGRLPLHVWLSHPTASLGMARLLVEAHSGSLQVQDNQGRAPLLVAVTKRGPSLGVVRLLVKACPQSIQSPNPEGLVPLKVAAAHDAPLDIVYFLARHRPELLSSGTNYVARAQVSVLYSTTTEPREVTGSDVSIQPRNSVSQLGKDTQKRAFGCLSTPSRDGPPLHASIADLRRLS